jgi:hypothetical protein
VIVTETIYTIHGFNEFGHPIYQQTTDPKKARHIYDCWVTAADISNVTIKPEPAESHQYKVGDKIYVGPDRYDESRAVGTAIVTKIMPGSGDFDDFIEVQFPPDLVTLDRVRPVQR